MKKTREEICIEAESWKGTPWAHMQAAKQAGVDCMGLIRAMYGFYHEVSTPDCEFYYPPGWFRPPIKYSILLEPLRRYIKEIPLSDLQPADVVAFDRYRTGVPTHCGVMTSDSTFIHVDSLKGAIISPYQIPWKSKVYTAFSFFDEAE